MSGESPSQTKKLLDNVLSVVQREKKHLLGEKDSDLTDDQVDSLKKMDMLSCSSDAAAYLSEQAIKELNEEEKALNLKERKSEETEQTGWFASLSTMFSLPTASTADFLSQITIGIRLATKSTAKDPPEKIYNHTLHQFENKKFNMNFDVKEYCAGAFMELRKLSNISPDDYVNEWDLPEERISASEGAGKSGALFCFSRNKKFIFKTIFRSEVDTLVGTIKDYLKYCKEQPNTFIMKMVGLYCLSRASVTSSETYVLVFGNVTWSGIDSPIKIHEIFDLKGRRTKVYSIFFK